MHRSLIQHAARWCGVVLVSRHNVALPYLEYRPRTLFDHVLVHCFPTRRGVNFIQIGANDGERADPIATYLEPGGWSGLMFEPLPANFAALSRRHGHNPRLRLRGTAVDTVAGRRPLHDIDHGAHPGLPDWTRGLASFSRERVLQAARELGLDEHAVVTDEIVAVAWAEVWRDFGPQRCDLLVLDTEGHDLILLRAADLAAHRPRIIHFEHACVEEDDRFAFYRELTALGYELATDGPDTTAWLRT